MQSNLHQKKTSWQRPVMALASMGFSLGFCLTAHAQVTGAAVVARQPLAFNTYLEAVERLSLDLAAQRSTIEAAQAGVSIAGVRPDPQFSYSTSREQNKAIDPRPLSQGPSLSYTFETAGKRDARLKAARSNVVVNEANVEGFRRQLFNDAATAFAEACRTREAVVRQESSLNALSDVVKANDARRRAGDVGGLELAQSRVERDRFESGVINARAAQQAAEYRLSALLGRRFAEEFGNSILYCDFAGFDPGSDMDRLLRQATENRQDILTARATLSNARDLADLARSNRWVDPTVSVGITRTPGNGASFDSLGNRLSDATPQSRVLSLSLSVPIPVSRMQNGELVQAEAAVTQALLNLQSVELKAETDVRSALVQFMAAQLNLKRYRESILVEADRVLAGMRLSYRNGAASLLELLSAQRSADETYLDYLQAQADLATATVQLQLSVGQRPSL